MSAENKTTAILSRHRRIQAQEEHKERADHARLVRACYEFICEDLQNLALDSSTDATIAAALMAKFMGEVGSEFCGYCIGVGCEECTGNGGSK